MTPKLQSGPWCLQYYTQDSSKASTVLSHAQQALKCHLPALFTPLFKVPLNNAQALPHPPFPHSIGGQDGIPVIGESGQVAWSK